MRLSLPQDHGTLYDAQLHISQFAYMDCASAVLFSIWHRHRQVSTCHSVIYVVNIWMFLRDLDNGRAIYKVPVSGPFASYGPNASMDDRSHTSGDSEEPHKLFPAEAVYVPDAWKWGVYLAKCKEDFREFLPVLQEGVRKGVQHNTCRWSKRYYHDRSSSSTVGLTGADSDSGERLENLTMYGAWDDDELNPRLELPEALAGRLQKVAAEKKLLAKQAHEARIKKDRSYYAQMTDWPNQVFHCLFDGCCVQGESVSSQPRGIDDHEQLVSDRPKKVENPAGKSTTERTGTGCYESGGWYWNDDEPGSRKNKSKKPFPNVSGAQVESVGHLSADPAEIRGRTDAAPGESVFKPSATAPFMILVTGLDLFEQADADTCSYNEELLQRGNFSPEEFADTYLLPQLRETFLRYHTLVEATRSAHKFQAWNAARVKEAANAFTGYYSIDCIINAIGATMLVLIFTCIGT